MLRIALATLGMAFLLPIQAAAGTSPGASTSALAANSQAGFLSSHDCFETTPDYDSWLASIQQQLGDQQVSRERLTQLVPARMFAFVRSGFDCRAVTYASDGHVVSGYVVQAKPDGSTGKRPLLVYNHGGNRELGRLDSLQLIRKLFPLAKAGYVVVASQYRGDADEFGGKDIDDVTRLIDLSRPLPAVDASHIFLLGESRGGMMNYLVARHRSDITAMATLGGATDLIADLQWRPEMVRVYRALIPGYDRNPQAALEARSSLYWAEQLPADMPILLLHGGADARVNVENSRAMAARLQELGRPHKLVVYPDDDHGIRQHAREARSEILNWFKSAQAR